MRGGKRIGAFQFYRSTIMTTYCLASGEPVPKFQFYRSTIMTEGGNAVLLRLHHRFNSTEVRLWRLCLRQFLASFFVSILQKYDYDRRYRLTPVQVFQSFNSTEVRLWLLSLCLATIPPKFQFYRSTIMTDDKDWQLVCLWVSILQKYDYDILIRPIAGAFNCFNSTEVRLWPGRWGRIWRLLVFQFYRSTIMTIADHVDIGINPSRFQFYRSTIMTSGAEYWQQGLHRFNSTEVRLWLAGSITKNK